jgi:pimeloyl-ACP methyl ester carboxylesterase
MLRHRCLIEKASNNTEGTGQFMKPIIFGGRFGWLHPGQGRRGVVLCSPFGHEETWSHEAIRYLAEQLSGCGFPTLRFDYRTTGDSVGVDGEGNPFDTFIIDVGAAVERLKKETGVNDVTLCGLRLGASVAASASRHCAVDSLVLLAPVTRGRVYLRELMALRKAWLEYVAPQIRNAQPDKPFNVLGQIYSEEFCNRLHVLNLPKEIADHPSMLRRAFVVDVRSGASDDLCTMLRAQGAEVTTERFDGYFEFMQETKSSIIPERTLESVAQWLAGSSGACVFKPMKKAAWPSVCVDEDPVIETPEALERPVIFGSAGLFGIMCEPRDRLAGSSVLLITNTASGVHHGDSRLSVRIAREMARRGIASLRIDARGIGDSPPVSRGVVTDTPISIHANSTIEDVATAAAWLKRKGYNAVVTFGICSGAYSALRAALIESAITGVIAVNLQRFYVPEDMTLRELEEQQRNVMARLGPALFKPTKWWLVLSGKRDFWSIAQAFASNVTARLRSPLATVEVRKAGPVSDETLKDPHQVVRALERKGVKTFLIYGVRDEGLDELNAHFGKNGKKLSRGSSVKTAVFTDVDHSLFDHRASARVIAVSELFINDLQLDLILSKKSDALI